MTKDNDFLEAALADPLRELTRRERRMLLAVSALSILVADVGLLPTKITALGIDFDARDQRSLYIVLACLVIYFFITFAVYAYSDFLSWSMRVKTCTMNAMMAHFNATHSPMDQINEETQRRLTLQMIEQHENETGNILDRARALLLSKTEIDAERDRVLGKPETWFTFWEKEIPASMWVREALDFGFPLVLGIVALWRVSSTWWSFPG